MRLASTDQSPFQWLLGGIYLRNLRTIYESIDIDGAGAVFASRGFPSDRVFFSDTLRRTVETAAFGEASYTLDQFTLTAGLRVVRNRLDRTDNAEGLLNNGLPRLYTSLKEFANTPKFAVSYKIDPTAMLYVQASKGYRVGQANTGLSADPASGQPIPRSYAPDTLWNYELGAKTAFLDNRLTLNGAVYDIEWKGIQLTQLSVTDGINFINNAGNARIRGAELELVAHPASWLELGSALTFTDARLTELDPGVMGRVGDRLPGSARFTASNYGRFDFTLFDSLASYVRVDHQFVGREYADLDNASSLTYGNYDLWSVRAAVDFPNVEVAVFVNNLFDIHGVASALNVSTVPVSIPLQPLTLGLTARALF
jgi:iron complex outermembrane receptor protein